MAIDFFGIKLDGSDNNKYSQTLQKTYKITEQQLLQALELQEEKPTCIFWDNTTKTLLLKTEIKEG